jgi:uncharacterized protein YjbI with pentapeptide repeats
MALKPLTYPDPLYQLLRDGDVKEFNQRKAQGEKSDLPSCYLRHLDLRGLDAVDLDLSDYYFRAADLRGSDFSQSPLEPASINGAPSPARCFPPSSTPAKSSYGFTQGTRMRYGK